ncbi:MAG TPA: alpha-glucan family phosphorylase [bacterium]|nr:alpha-glucan family phosphorylase [bacterium]
MKVLEHHFPFLPERLIRLGDLAYNLWFSWHSKAVDLFKEMDQPLWERTGRNPVRMLHEVDAGRIEELAGEKAYVRKYDAVIRAMDHYLTDKKTWFNIRHEAFPGPVAYFSMEFGVHESLPIYSGGLGILAGDHLKSASDLGIPLVGVGLLYRESYFTQQISLSGHQQSHYVYNNFSNLPVRAVMGKNGDQLTIHVVTDGKQIAAKLWQAQIGRVPLYLLDTDLPENSNGDRKITERLYVGDRDMRLLQEILLGIGGVRALDAIGIAPSVWHMNEGHCSFLIVERIRRLVESGMPFDQAVEEIRKTTVFTTHTPIPAGNEMFETARIESAFRPCWEKLGIDRDRFMRLGQSRKDPDPHAFNMTILALYHSREANAVSRLHGTVSRHMWQHVFPDRSAEEVPIRAITNGVHTRTWMAGPMKDLLDRYLGPDWRHQITETAIWEKVGRIPDKVLWETHQTLKKALLEEVRCRLVRERDRNGESGDALREAEAILNPEFLTLGFARRFAQYKRGAMLFRDRERLKHLLTGSDRPVQILFAGKAHPADQPGKALIREIYQESRNPEFQNRIVFVENYDITLARHLVSGVDVWLNTPRRPLEASGTSGMKVAANGGINLSVLDGWWREAYQEDNGWAIGEDRDYYNEWEQDETDSQSLYNLLEHAVIPLYYTRNGEGIPEGWVKRMKASMTAVIPVFNTHRMLMEYVESMYLPKPSGK